MKASPSRKSPKLSRRFKRLSASLHVKAQKSISSPLKRLFQTPFGITACESWANVDFLSANALFQTPFGITACESGHNAEQRNANCRFQTPFGITACESRRFLSIDLAFIEFQTPFGITACESSPEKYLFVLSYIVSNAFRHHCM